MFPKVQYFLALLLMGVLIPARAAAIECAGPEKASLHVVYLHGLDTESSTRWYEDENRRLLTEWALGQKTPTVRIAFPRATERCPSSRKLRCWVLGTKEVVAAQYDKILLDSQECGEGFKAPDMIIGFSRGGMFTASLSEFCLSSTSQKLIIVGAGSQGYPEPMTGGCAPATILYGTQDPWAKPRARALYRVLRNLHPETTLQTYAGKHVMTPEMISLVDALITKQTP